MTGASLSPTLPTSRSRAAINPWVVAAVVVVPTALGGWITDDYSWRWVFWINVPVGLLALGACAITLRDPDYLTAQRMELRKRPFSFDGVGLSLLVVTVICWEVMLSKGQCGILDRE
jgi:MFS transporter, DHA2 family, multidrug resistance protein